jgi:glucose-6-phosphate 1-dehydrogenase
MQNFDLIIFGITGNLAQTKLLPALVRLKNKNLLPKKLKIIGIARHTPEIPKELAQFFEYIEGDVEKDLDLYTKIKKSLAYQNHLYYLATFPNLYETIFTSLKNNGLNKNKNGWIRLIIEKPLGKDLKSAKKLDIILHECFKESEIYRIDHYLGKITFQNILVFRFGNELFEPLLNKNYVDHIQITAAEKIGIENRGFYFDNTGTLKDVGQNHLLQMLVATTMEAPSEFSNEEVTKQRIKILKNLVPNPDAIIFGQYKGYLKEKDVKKNSWTNTFFALKTEIKNKRWKGVPIYIRAGKALQKNIAEISIVFKIPQNRLFKNYKFGKKPNVLTYRVQPNEGIEIEILTKHPSLNLKLDQDLLEFSYTHRANYIPDAYQKLIYDAILGDGTFFNDAIEVEASWKFIDKLNKKNQKPIIYNTESWGPKEADRLIEIDGRKWIKK